MNGIEKDYVEIIRLRGNYRRRFGALIYGNGQFDFR